MSITISILCALALLSCKKSDGDAAPTNVAPSNLVIQSTVSMDGSGKVDFKSTAINASTYQYDLGDGESLVSTNGIASYIYKKPGTNTYVVTVKASNASGQSISKSTQVSVTVAGGSAEPQLLWSDEFNTNGAPDPAKWGYDIGRGDNGWGNAELQYYTNRAENVSVQDGKLKITARKENYSGAAYTSARLLSKGKYSMKYGRVEISAKMPEGVGTWPALWMLGNNIDAVSWPACGEIDIMEHLGRDLNKIYATLHYPGRSGGNADGNTRTIANATTEFHKYTLIWTASTIQMLVDDQPIHTVNNSSSLPFNQNFFFLINMAVGGNFAGAVDPAFTNATFEVDYLRVYDR
ncbi:family 16 glycosylhydrolase [Flavihumibacter sp. ZG627]|uniref:family 16 glycosylhydrolase n=1 Tax=Flavihumibacter sp. ZG627 TaxID=1463156 RepID=UPI001C11D5CA|nr:family 16 glycosylhydrolase [Flavihumibacter sp. ZG627]